MIATSRRLSFGRLRSHYRPLILTALAVCLLSVFWFASRYPQLLAKAEHAGRVVPSMTYTHEVIAVTAADPVWWRIVGGTVNWLDSMKIGMTFGVLLGALLHTALRYYPPNFGGNYTLNTLKGALVGVPMGVCANCAVPTACGVTRGNGRIEVALGFLFSSPNFNPVVVVITFLALPLAMSVTKYVLLLLVIVLILPALIRSLERRRMVNIVSANRGTSSCSDLPPTSDADESFSAVVIDVAVQYAKHIWMLLKPTIVIMLLASVLSSTLLALVSWEQWFSEVTFGKIALVSLISVFMPVPIALDVLFAAQLHQQGVAGGYVMVFAMTLGTYSIIPCIYLWCEASKTLAIGLFGLFLTIGCTLGLVF